MRYSKLKRVYHLYMSTESGRTGETSLQSSNQRGTFAQILRYFSNVFLDTNYNFTLSKISQIK